MVISLALMNLILAVVVEAASDARAAGMAEKAEEEHQKLLAAKQRLLDCCTEMDADGSGTITMEEFMDAYNESENFRSLVKSMDVDVHELDMLFEVVDDDASGHVEYGEFVDQLDRMKHQTSQMILFTVGSVKRHVRTLEAQLANKGGQFNCFKSSTESHQSHHSHAKPAAKPIGDRPSNLDKTGLCESLCPCTSSPGASAPQKPGGTEVVQRGGNVVQNSNIVVQKNSPANAPPPPKRTGYV